MAAMSKPLERMKALRGGWRRRSLSVRHLCCQLQRANMGLDIERIKELVGGDKSGSSQLVIFVCCSNMPPWFRWVA